MACWASKRKTRKYYMTTYCAQYYPLHVTVEQYCDLSTFGESIICAWLQAMHANLAKWFLPRLLSWLVDITANAAGDMDWIRLERLTDRVRLKRLTAIGRDRWQFLYSGQKRTILLLVVRRRTGNFIHLLLRYVASTSNLRDNF